MNRKHLLWLLAIVSIAVFVAVQVTNSSINRAEFIAGADTPTVAPGVDVLAGIAQIPVRIRGMDYRRDAFGDSWTDENPAPGGYNGCDTRFLGGFGMLRETLQEVGFKQGTLR